MTEPTRIDAHAHLFTKEEGQALGRALTLEEVLLPDLEREMDGASVSAAVVLPVGRTDDHICACLDARPSRLRVVLVHDRAAAAAPQTVVARLQRCGAIGLRLFGLGPGGERLRERDDFPILMALAEAREILWLYPQEGDYRAVTEFAAELPELTVVLNHLGFPWASSSPDGAATSLAGCLRAAENERCHVTISGQWAFSSLGYPFIDLHPRVRALYSAYGATRLLWASDFPGCLAASSYAEQLAAVDEHLPNLSPGDRQLILGENARSLFGFDLGAAAPAPTTRDQEASSR